MHRIAWLALLAGLAACGDCAGLPDIIPPGTDGGAPGVEPMCDGDDDCPLGWLCDDGVCVAVLATELDTGCVDDDDCADGELCAVTTGRCVVDAPTPGVPTGPPGACNDGEQRTCGEKIGACDYGVELCAGGAWSGTCTGAIGPVNEACNSVDDDCDGDADEDYAGVGQPCGEGDGVCRQFGVSVCTADGLTTQCTATPLSAAGRTELCGNDLDDNCDGTPDEGFEAVDGPCLVGALPCQIEGVVVCSTDRLSTLCQAATTELCNGVDDNGDTNGCVDEGFDLDAGCATGVGVCARPGKKVCSADGTTTVCDAVSAPPALVETCDGDDDDCNNSIDNGCDDDLDDYCDGTLVFVGSSPRCPLSTSPSLLDCNDDLANVHPGATEFCRNGIDENCSQGENDCPDCSATTDRDFDGANECVDCDDRNGARKPAAQGGFERCNGFDDDCDGVVDNGFDADGDGYTTCGTNPAGGLNPARIDCRDDAAAINPGACELCLLAGQTVCGLEDSDDGNGVDEDCDGYVDEFCRPCDPVDRDGDGVSECQGDCLPGNGNVKPGNAEVCDGLDTDCNIHTVENCDVSDPCNFASGADTCMDGLLCVEALGGGGNPTGDFSCTSLCNATSVGAAAPVLGDTCDIDETCRLSLTPSENVHGCGVTTDFGAIPPGGDCSRDDQCRSGRCVQFGNGQNRQEYCVDTCTSDAYCPAGTSCQIQVGFVGPSLVYQVSCLRVGATQTLQPGASCTAAPSTCRNGAGSCFNTADPASTSNKTCHAPCCSNADCDADEHCAMNSREFAGPNGGVDAFTTCEPKIGGNGGRPSGAACTTNEQCAGEFCDVLLGVCVETCCSDASCPTGQTCEMNLVTLPSGNETFARMCVSFTPADNLEAR